MSSSTKTHLLIVLIVILIFSLVFNVMKWQAVSYCEPCHCPEFKFPTYKFLLVGL